MKTGRFTTAVAAVSACAFALAVCVGCGSSTTNDSAETAPAAEEQQTETTTEDTSAIAAETAISLGYQVFEGELHVVSAEELLALQESDIDPAVASGGGTYAVLVFDQETEVSGMSADGSGERTEMAKMLGVAEHTDYDNFVVEYGDLDSWKSFDGQHIMVAAKAEDIMFPSDVRLPINEPTASSATVLK